MAVNCRVENKNFNINATREEKDRSLKNMLAIFRRRVNESGILTEYKQNQFYESKGEKRRRKKKESIKNIRMEQKLLNKKKVFKKKPSVDTKKVREFFN